MADFLLYGAYGYTGKLITDLANAYGLQPLLAGRSEAPLKTLAQTYGYDYRVFTLSDTPLLHAALAEVPVVLHAAGPFSQTATEMQTACLETQTHYLDITGEIAVFEASKQQHKAAIAAGIVLMSGVGFDVVPSDCLAVYLKHLLPDATHLRLAFSGLRSGFSRGTARTMVESLGEGGAVRENGRIKRVPLGHRSATIPFAQDFDRFAMTIPWGDVSTAYHSTGIPNIEVYTAISPRRYQWIKRQRYYNWLLRIPLVRAYAKNRVDKGPAGPSEADRKNGKSFLWGEVTNAAGERRAARIEGPEGYTLTAITSLLIVKRVLEGAWQAGYHSPASLYGPDLILEVPGTQRELILTPKSI